MDAAEKYGYVASEERRAASIDAPKKDIGIVSALDYVIGL
mgnify:CR=1 FL=1